nr:hypothetical protein [uncultured Draconibacterium sp.]
MKTINLYFKFQFTSLSPDAQPISLGIVSGEANEKNLPIGVVTEYQSEFIDYVRNKGEIVGNVNRSRIGDFMRLTKVTDLCSWLFSDIVVLSLPNEFKKFPEELKAAQKIQVVKKLPGKSFYTEFSFDINRCDDWVKENVILKTDVGSNKNVYPEYKPVVHFYNSEEKGIAKGYGDTERIKGFLKEWLKQFSDYQIQFVCDCGSLDWLWMSNYLLDERVDNKAVLIIDRSTIKEEDIDKFIQEYKKQPHVILRESDCKASTPVYYKTGFPKLPDNISPVPSDLNDLIATKKGITPKEAFCLNREKLLFGKDFPSPCLVVDGKKYSKEDISKIEKEYRESSDKIYPKDCTEIKIKNSKHNALWDAKVIKEIYQKLK